MAEERGLSVDVDGFNHAMDEARERSRSAQTKVRDYSFVVSLKFTRDLAILYPQNHKLHLLLCSHGDSIGTPFFLPTLPVSLLIPQQSGGAIVMNVDATASLHKRAIAATDDSFKFTWSEVSHFNSNFYWFFTHPWIKWATIWWNKLAAKKSPSSRTGIALNGATAIIIVIINRLFCANHTRYTKVR